MNSHDYANRLVAALTHYPHDAYRVVREALSACRARDGTLYVCGNGGSAATASHWVADFVTLCDFPTICLGDNVPRLTADANDTSYGATFSRLLRVLLRDRDCLLAISGSGNSPNILQAVRYAAIRCPTIGLTGMGGGALRSEVTHALVMPSDDMQIVEDMHLTTLHMLTQHFRTRVQ